MKNSSNEKQYVHGDHWAAVTDKVEDLAAIIVNNVHTNKKDDIVISGEDRFMGTVSGKPPIKDLALIGTNEKELFLATSYPFLHINNPITLKVDKIEEWPGKIEAMLVGTTKEGACLGFFDTLYFKNKDKYKIGESYVFNIAALGSHIQKRDPSIIEFEAKKGPMKGEMISTVGLTAYQPDEEYFDEFIIMTPLQLSGKVYKAYKKGFSEIVFGLKSGDEDDSILFKFPIFIKKKILEEADVSEGDDIDCSGWLQGYLANTI